MNQPWRAASDLGGNQGISLNPREESVSKRGSDYLLHAACRSSTMRPKS